MSLAMAGTRPIEVQTNLTVSSELSVKEFRPEVAERWDRFVFDNPQASFFHLSGWKRVIEKTYGYQAYYLYVERNGEITGVAPFFYISNWLVGRCLVSIPLAAYGGICAEDKSSEQCLVEHAKKLATDREVDYLELRHRSGGLIAGFHANSLYVTFSTPLFSDPELNRKRLPKDTRYMIRKAEKSRLEVRTGANLLAPAFYDLFAKSMQRLGTPVFSRKLFQNILKEFPSQTHLMVVYNEDKPVSGVLSFLFRDAILPYYAGASSEAPRLAANNLMYWSLMEWAARQGYRNFDFGRSKKNTGSFAFKSQWSMDVHQLDYQVYLVKRKTVPSFSPANPKFDLAIRVWRNLPLPVTKILGPKIIRLLP